MDTKPLAMGRCVELPRPDIWKKWRYIPECQLWEAVCLSMDLEPAGFAQANGYSEFRRADYRDRLEVALANLSAEGAIRPAEECPAGVGKQHSVVYLSEVSAAAIAWGWTIPDGMRELATIAHQTSNEASVSSTAHEQILGLNEQEIPSSRLEPVASVCKTTDSQRNEDGLSKREKQIRAIEDAATELGYGRLSIPTGGKTKLRKTCKETRPDLFGFGDDPFNDAWKDANNSVPPRLRMKEHTKFSSK